MYYVSIEFVIYESNRNHNPFLIAWVMRCIRLTQKSGVSICILSICGWSRISHINPTHLTHLFGFMGATFKGKMNQSVVETRESNVLGWYLISYWVYVVLPFHWNSNLWPKMHVNHKETLWWSVYLGTVVQIKMWINMIWFSC